MKKSQSICLHVSLVEIVISFLSSKNNTNKMYISRTGKRLRRVSVSLVNKIYLSEVSATPQILYCVTPVANCICCNNKRKLHKKYKSIKNSVKLIMQSLKTAQ